MSEAHHHHDRHGGYGVLLLALAFTLLFAFVEAAAGWWSNSLALIGDAGHMVTDSLALGLGALAAWMSRKPPSGRHSYGLKRAEVIGALANIVFMALVVTYIGIEAVGRWTSPEPVKGGVVMVVAALGLAVNAVVARVLHGGEQNLNVRGALLHVLGDLLGSAAALVAGAVVWLTAWYPIDPILSLVIGILILLSSLRLLGDVLHVIMEGVPRDIDLEVVGRDLASVDGVRHVHDLHVWALDSSTYAVSAHVVVGKMTAWESCRARLEARLLERFGISHATLQPEEVGTFDSKCAENSCGPVYSGNAPPDSPGEPVSPPRPDRLRP
jgi:cobalt-zinc-cadmium efflux system protein